MSASELNTNDERIREFAYQIWESEGKPAGQETRHWEMARKLAEAEATAAKLPATRARRVSKAKETAQPAAAKPAKPATPRKSKASGKV